MRARLVTLLLLTAPAVALAANGIDVSRAPDKVEFGSCVPSLTVENKSAETIDYLQVDLVMTLANGQERTVELKSAYRTGVPLPIAPGGQTVLKQQLDLEKALGVTCSDIRERKVARTICETPAGTACASQIVVKP